MYFIFLYEQWEEGRRPGWGRRSLQPAPGPRRRDRLLFLDPAVNTPRNSLRRRRDQLLLLDSAVKIPRNLLRRRRDRIFSSIPPSIHLEIRSADGGIGFFSQSRRQNVSKSGIAVRITIPMTSRRIFAPSFIRIRVQDAIPMLFSQFHRFIFFGIAGLVGGAVEREPPRHRWIRRRGGPAVFH